MTRQTLRGLASGLLTAAVILGGYHFMDKQKEEAAPVSSFNEASKEHPNEAKKARKDEKGPAVKEEQTDKKEPSADQGEPLENMEPLTIRIEEGTTANQIGQMLKNNGIIDDPVLFTSYMEENGLSKKVQIGNFEVTKQMTVEEIAQIITE